MSHTHAGRCLELVGGERQTKGLPKNMLRAPYPIQRATTSQQGFVCSHKHHPETNSLNMAPEADVQTNPKLFSSVAVRWNQKLFQNMAPKRDAQTNGNTPRTTPFRPPKKRNHALAHGTKHLWMFRVSVFRVTGRFRSKDSDTGKSSDLWANRPFCDTKAVASQSSIKRQSYWNHGNWQPQIDHHLPQASVESWMGGSKCSRPRANRKHVRLCVHSRSNTLGMPKRCATDSQSFPPWMLVVHFCRVPLFDYPKLDLHGVLLLGVHEPPLDLAVAQN